MDIKARFNLDLDESKVKKMYQNCCKKCGSILLHTEPKGNNVGLYCDDCGAWIKWLGKDELRAFEHSMREATKEERESVNKYIESISKPTGNTFTSTIKERLDRFINAIDETIDVEYEKLPISTEDAIRKNTYCLALEKCKTAILNILNGREFNEDGN